MTVIIPARALQVEREIKDCREALRRSAMKIETCENVDDAEFTFLVNSLPHQRAALLLAKAEMRLLLAEARPAPRRKKE